MTLSGCRQALDALLRTRGLVRPDGRPLYAYRVDGAELARVRAALRAEFAVAAVRPDFHASALFCLYGAEWWRTEYDGGTWAWAPVFAAAGIEATLPIHLIYPSVACGLRYWRVPLLQIGGGATPLKRGWLTSLACQGGLPMRVLHREGAGIREFLRQVLRDRVRFAAEHISTSQLAADHERSLPARLRNEVFLGLGASVVDAVAHLLSFHPDAQDPVADLARRVPSWHTQLPLDVDDTAAAELLTLLVRDGVETRGGRRAGVSVLTVITHSPVGWLLERQLALPATTCASTFAAFTRRPTSELPQRFELYWRVPGGGKDRVATATTLSTAAEDPLVLLETDGAPQPVVRGAAAVRSVEIELTAARQRIGSASPPGGGPLADLPWIFVERGIDAGRARLFAQGSARARDPFVYVAVPPGARLEVPASTTVEAAGPLLATGRELVRVSGMLRIVLADGAVTLVATGTPDDDALEYVPTYADLEDAAGLPLHRAVPRLLRFRADGARADEIAANELEWRPAGSGPWRPDARGALGHCDIRHAPGGEVRYQGRFAIVPPGFAQTIAALPAGTGGTVTLEGLPPTALVARSTDAGVEVTPRWDPPAWRLEVTATGEPPTTFHADLAFRGAGDLRITLPFPVRTARFVGRAGRALPDDATLCLDQLGGVVAQVLAPGQKGAYAVELSLRCAPGQYLLATNLDLEAPLAETFAGCHELDLAHVRADLELMLTATTALDACIDARIRAVRGAAVPLKKLQITRYDTTFHLRKRDGVVEVRSERTGQIIDRSTLVVRVLPLLTPSAAEELPRLGDGVWQFGGTREPGPWVLAGFEGEYCTVRPTLWTVRGAPPAGARSGPADVATLPDAEARRDRYAAYLTALAETPADGAWGFVRDSIEAFWSMPPTAHDLFVGLSRAPSALPAVLLALPSEKVRRAWAYLERLPILWHCVPLAAWTRTLRRRGDALRRTLDAVDGFSAQEIEALAEDAVAEALAPLRGTYPAIELIALLAHPPGRTPRTAVGTPTQLLHPIILKTVLAGWRERVMAAIGTRRLPEWPGLRGARRSIDHALAPPAGTWTTEGIPLYATSLVDAPACAAWACAGAVALPAASIFHLRRLRAFDAAGFDQAYAAHLGLAIGHLQATHPEVLA